MIGNTLIVRNLLFAASASALTCTKGIEPWNHSIDSWCQEPKFGDVRKERCVCDGDSPTQSTTVKPTPDPHTQPTTVNPETQATTANPQTDPHTEPTTKYPIKPCDDSTTVKPTPDPHTQPTTVNPKTDPHTQPTTKDPSKTDPVKPDPEPLGDEIKGYYYFDYEPPTYQGGNPTGVGPEGHSDTSYKQTKPKGTISIVFDGHDSIDGHDSVCDNWRNYKKNTVDADERAQLGSIDDIKKNWKALPHALTPDNRWITIGGDHTQWTIEQMEEYIANVQDKKHCLYTLPIIPVSMDQDDADGYKKDENPKLATQTYANGSSDAFGFQGVIFDIESDIQGDFDAWKKTFDKMITAFKDAKFQTGVTISHSAPFGLRTHPENLGKFIKAMCDHSDLDIVSPQLYTNGDRREQWDKTTEIMAPANNDFVNAGWERYHGCKAKFVPSIIDPSMYPDIVKAFKDNSTVAGKKIYRDGVTERITPHGFIQWYQNSKHYNTGSKRALSTLYV